MATKSFQSDFKFNRKASYKFVEALEKSKQVKHVMNQPVNELKSKEAINELMANFLRK